MACYILQIVQREYRGQRTSEAIAAYIRDQIKDPVEAIHDIEQLASKVCMCVSVTPSLCEGVSRTPLPRMRVGMTPLSCMCVSVIPSPCVGVSRTPLPCACVSSMYVC